MEKHRNRESRFNQTSWDLIPGLSQDVRHEPSRASVSEVRDVCSAVFLNHADLASLLASKMDETSPTMPSPTTRQSSLRFVLRSQLQDTGNSRS
jgi:hypothetical protein